MSYYYPETRLKSTHLTNRFANKNCQYRKSNLNKTALPSVSAQNLLLKRIEVPF